MIAENPSDILDKSQASFSSPPNVVIVRCRIACLYGMYLSYLNLVAAINLELVGSDLFFRSVKAQVFGTARSITEQRWGRLRDCMDM